MDMDLERMIEQGRKLLKEREKKDVTEMQTAAVARRLELYRAWGPLLQRLQGILTPELGACVVAPTMTPDEELMNGCVRPLVLDLTPFGLGPLGAFLDESKPNGVGWMVPSVEVLEDTGEKRFFLSCHSLSMVDRVPSVYSFLDALAILADEAEAVRQHNEKVRAGWEMFNPWSLPPVEAFEPAAAEEPAPPDLYAALAHQGGGCYPVVRIGNNSERVHAEGREAAVSFGVNFGADGWERHMAVHTFTFNDIPDDGELYGYVALIPVNPSQWREVMGGGEAQ